MYFSCAFSVFIPTEDSGNEKMRSYAGAWERGESFTLPPVSQQLRTLRLFIRCFAASLRKHLTNASAFLPKGKKVKIQNLKGPGKAKAQVVDAVAQRIEATIR